MKAGAAARSSLHVIFQRAIPSISMYVLRLFPSPATPAAAAAEVILQLLLKLLHVYR